jgi:threonine/homoserine/homoserine lactone efflux protein
MLEAALAGALAGYAIAIPVGAIAVLIIHIGLSRGFRAGVAAAAGAASADGIYATIAGFAGAVVAGLVGPLLVPLQIAGGLVLVALGVRGLLTLRTPRESADDAIHSAVHTPHGRTYLELLGLTLLNPATIVYFTALTVGLPFLGGLGERLVFAAAAFVASFSWQVLLAGFGAALGRGAGHRLRRPTQVIGNVIVIALGALIVYGGLAPTAPGT